MERELSVGDLDFTQFFYSEVHMAHFLGFESGISPDLQSDFRYPIDRRHNLLHLLRV